MEGLRQVSSDIAHDLRTPLARLHHGLESVRRKAVTVAEYEEAFEQAIAETNGILRIFGALLRIAQIGAGTRRAGFSAVDLSAVFETIVETYAAVAEDNGQTLSGRIRAGVVVRGDKELLTQMLANLVENAIHHTPAASQIEVSLEAPRGRPVGVVADTGPGIPVGEREKVFRRFYRLDSSRTTIGSGLGFSPRGSKTDTWKAIDDGRFILVTRVSPFHNRVSPFLARPVGTMMLPVSAGSSCPGMRR